MSVAERKTPVVGEDRPHGERTVRDLVWSSVFSYVLALVIVVIVIASLISIGQFWPVLGYTRLLDWMVRSGVVQLHDGQLGIIRGGVDLLGHWFASQDPVDVGLVAFAVLLLLGAWAVRGVQFHGITQFCGIDATTGMSLRAYLYGRGVDLFLPFNAGKAAAVSALVGQGAAVERAGLAAFSAQLFLVFEIIVFGIVGIIYLGWTTWFQLMAWAVLLLAAAYLLTYGRFRFRAASTQRLLASAKGVSHALLSDLGIVLCLGSLSILAFALEVAVIYALCHAFSGPNVVLLVQPPLIMMGLIAGYLASMVKVTPGGIGQFELAFAAAVFLGGTGIPDTVAITVLYMAFRYLVGAIMLGTVTLAYGTGTNLKEVTKLLTGPEVELGAIDLPAGATVSGNTSRVLSHE